MTYRLVDVHGRLDAWLDDDSHDRPAMLEWWAKLTDDPTSVEGTPVPNWMDLPAMAAVIPELGVQVVWAVLTSPPFAREYECVAVVDVADV